MDSKTFPTKGNLIAAKNTVKLSRQGYDLLDRKRNILIRELMALMEKAEKLQERINKAFVRVYDDLKSANISMGVSKVEAMARAVPLENGVTIKTRSVMGVEIPRVSIKDTEDEPPFGLYSMTTSLDAAYKSFNEVKMLSLKLAETETAAYRLAVNIKKTQKRANALKNITIPRYEKLISDITSSLEEKEREEFTRLKVIKAQTIKKKR